MKIKLENLDNIKVGDLLCDNVSKKPYRVYAVSEHYILAFQNNFGKDYYTIFSKIPSGMYISHYKFMKHWVRHYNKSDKLFYYRGPDDLVFGGVDKDDDLDDYMNKLESDEIEISLKHRVTLLEIYQVVKKGGSSC